MNVADDVRSDVCCILGVCGKNRPILGGDYRTLLGGDYRPKYVAAIFRSNILIISPVDFIDDR